MFEFEPNPLPPGNCTQEEIAVLLDVAKKSGVGMHPTDHSLLDALCLQAKMLIESEIKNPFGYGLSEKQVWNLIRENGVVLTFNDYLRATSIALSLFDHLANTDFGTSRQRSFGQKWADTIQGLLGEIAFRKVIDAHTKGQLVPFPDAGELDLNEALKTDITQVLVERKEKRPTKKRISIKTTKLRGRWLDVPYNQASHSDIYVLVKVGTDPGTLYWFLAKSKLIDQIILSHQKLLKESDPIFEHEHAAANRALERVSNIKSKPALFLAVVSGWKTREELDQPFNALAHNASSARARKKVRVYSGFGRLIPPLKAKNIIKSVPAQKAGASVEFDPIGEFSNANRSICSVDCLEKSLEGLIGMI